MERSTVRPCVAAPFLLVFLNIQSVSHIGVPHTQLELETLAMMQFRGTIREAVRKS